MNVFEVLRGMKILLVEDDPWTRDALKLFFEVEGCGLLALGSAGEGIDALHKEKYDLIISDYWLPDIDGLTFFRLYGTMQPDAMKVLITAYPTKGTIAEAGESGVDACIKKPFTGRFLEESLERLIRERKRTPEGTGKGEPVIAK